MEAGEVYRPVAETLPTPAGERLQVTCWVCCTGMDAGEVYRPVAETLPIPAGDRFQFTCWFVEPDTVAVSCRVWLAVNEADGGFTEMVTGGFKAIAATAAFVGSATLVAVTVTVC